MKSSTIVLKVLVGVYLGLILFGLTSLVVAMAAGLVDPSNW